MKKDPIVAAEKRPLLLERLDRMVKKGKPVPFIPGVNIDEADLDEHQKQLFAFALDSARGVFAIDDTDLSCTDLVKHKIDTGDAIPIKYRAFRTPFSFQEELEKLIHEMPEQGVIEASNSPWASLIVILQSPIKSNPSPKDGFLRLCIDFRKVNAVTRKVVTPYR